MYIRDIIKYIIIFCIVIAISLLIRNIITPDSSKVKINNTNELHSVTISLKDKENDKLLSGGTLVVKNDKNEILTEITTSGKLIKVNNLKNGKYIIEQSQAPENYKKSEITKFTIKNKDADIVIYNNALTEEEQREINTVSNEINVDNTASNKNVLINIVSILIIAIGFIKIKNKLVD